MRKNDQNIELVKTTIEADPLFIHFLIGWLNPHHEDMADAARIWAKTWRGKGIRPETEPLPEWEGLEHDQPRPWRTDPQETS